MTAQKVLAITRIALGFIFTWAFLDKLLGLGFATKQENAVINGGSATEGYLKFATSGPLESIYQQLAGNQLVEWVFMLGLLAIGISLILGIFMRIAIWAASIMMLLMWSANLPPANNPILDSHIIYILVLVAIGQAKAGDIWSLSSRANKS